MPRQFDPSGSMNVLQVRRILATATRRPRQSQTAYKLLEAANHFGRARARDTVESQLMTALGRRVERSMQIARCLGQNNVAFVCEMPAKGDLVSINVFPMLGCPGHDDRSGAETTRLANAGRTALSDDDVSSCKLFL